MTRLKFSWFNHTPSLVALRVDQTEHQNKILGRNVSWEEWGWPARKCSLPAKMETPAYASRKGRGGGGYGHLGLVPIIPFVDIYHANSYKLAFNLMAISHLSDRLPN